VCEFPLPVTEKTLEPRDEFGSDGLQLVQVVQSKLAKGFLAVMSQFNEHLASIIGGPDANQQTPIREPVDESDGAVMLKLHSFSQNVDAWTQIIRANP